MKKNILVLFMLSLLVLITSCGKTKEEELAEQVGEVMQQQNNIQNDMIEIAQKNASGEISDEEYDNKMEELNKGYEDIDRKIDNSATKLGENDFPKWAKKLGLRKINGLDFDEVESEIVEVESDAGFDGVNLVYFGTDYEKVISEAEKLAKDLSIEELSISPRKNIDSISNMMGSIGTNNEQMAEMQAEMAKTMGGALFANCTLGADCKVEDKFSKMISVEENGEKWKINISLINIEQWENQMNKYNTVTN